MYDRESEAPMSDVRPTTSNLRRGFRTISIPAAAAVGCLIGLGAIAPVRAAAAIGWEAVMVAALYAAAVVVLFYETK